MNGVCSGVPAALAGVAFLVAELAARWLSRPGHPLAVVDRPNERSLHDVPRPRSGGLAILGGVAAALITWLALPPSARCFSAAAPVPANPLWWILGGVLAAAALSLLDDVRGIAPGVRLPLHLGIGATLALGGELVVRDIPVPGIGVLALGAMAVPITIVVLVWMANLYNFMDGMDGFSGGMTVFGFACLAVLSWRGGAEAPALVALLVSAAAAGFLRHNFPPARIFMGDVGAVPLGFLAGALAIWGMREGAFQVWAPLLAFSPFIVDATVTLVRRLLRGERLWQAHRSHYYQRLVLAGWGHRRTVISEYVLMGAVGLSALAYEGLSTPARAWILTGWIAAYTGLALTVERRVRGDEPSR